MGGRRCNSAELASRVTLVVELITAGFRSNEILHYISHAKNSEGKYKLDWHNISERQVKFYIQKANVYFRSKADIDRRKATGRAIIRYQNIYKVALRDKEYYTAIRALERMDKIMGIEAPIKLDKSITIDELFEKLPDDFKKEVLEEFEAEV